MTWGEAKEQAARDQGFISLYNAFDTLNAFGLEPLMNKAMKLYAREVADKAYDAGYKARMSSNYVPTKEEFMKQLDI